MEKDNVNEPVQPYGQPTSFDQVWRLFQETDKQFRETDKQFRETDKQFWETGRRFQETKKQIRENDRILTERFKDTDKKIKEISALFTTQWGNLIETLVEGDLVKLLNEKNIRVAQTTERIKGTHEGQNFEYDIVAINGKEVVIVEVKTTLRADDVKEFHQKIWKAKTYLSQYKDNIIYGCVAFLKAEEASDRMAEKLGFFVIKATGSSASIINKGDFVPKAF
ncbi:MAG: hypothetical protein RBR47_00870 [Bacteroidales bacterium]|jgi:hypothetical protein|nr:hypothetical protein [Bacteroidales bacterium]MDY0333487.1 hypothetical protein [Bacteroidales bacterium]NLO52675.1 hypothetical protein [Bacteroidales bacterium]